MLREMFIALLLHLTWDINISSKFKWLKEVLYVVLKDKNHNCFFENHKTYRFHVLKLSKAKRIPEYLEQLREEFSDLIILRQNN